MSVSMGRGEAASPDAPRAPLGALGGFTCSAGTVSYGSSVDVVSTIVQSETVGSQFGSMPRSAADVAMSVSDASVVEGSTVGSPLAPSAHAASLQAASLQAASLQAALPQAADAQAASLQAALAHAADDQAALLQAALPHAA